MIKKLTITNLFISILFLLVLIGAGLIFVINFRPLYYFDIDFLKIPQLSGLPQDVIKENYNALIDYCSPFFRGPLELPSLPSSNNGIQHFVEVKNLFTAFHIVGFLSLCLLVVMIIYKKRKQDYSYLLVSSIGILVLPAIVVLGISVNFSAAFELFHKLFFRNDYWIFIPEHDPIITILPEAFFMHCALVIIAFILIGSLILYLLYRRSRKKDRGE